MEMIINNINTIIKFLAKRDILKLTIEELQQKYNVDQVDLLILMGNSIPYISQQAALAYKSKIAKQFMIAGGEGHSTQGLRNNVNQKYPYFDTIGKPEADILVDLLYLEFGIPRSEILIDNESTNCGENAKFALKVLKENALSLKTVLLMQDPTMQLRMDASFKKAWKEEGVTFIGYAAFVPQVYDKGGKLVFKDNDIWGLWEMEHFISLIMSEIPRLLDTTEGYGPNGKNFITHVNVPEEVIAAYKSLSVIYEKLIRK